MEALPRVRHKKRGTEYDVIGYGMMQAEHWRDHENNTTDGIDIFPGAVDMQQVVIYRSVDDGQFWVRPIGEFQDGRFEAAALAAGTEWDGVLGCR